MKPLYVGVDGGGTRTRVLVVDADGATVATAEAQGSTVVPGAVERSADVIMSAVSDAVLAAEGTMADVRAACVGVAGVGRPAEREELHDMLDARSLAPQLIVTTDAEIALDDAFPGGPGVLLIAGTGSIAYGRGPTGTLARCGGWGAICGDEGGGSWLGRRTLSVITAASDGREPETTLLGASLAALGLSDMDQIVRWAASATPADIAMLAPVVLDCAAAGDLRANSLLTLAVEELGLHVRTLARQLFGDERAAVPVAFAGGLLAKGSLLRKRLEMRLKSMTPGGQIQAHEVVAVRGAALRALRLDGRSVQAIGPRPPTDGVASVAPTPA